MTLTELCEPLFQYICRLNRSARKGCAHDLSGVRSEVKSIFSTMNDGSISTPGLSDQFAKVRMPLIYFVDWIMRNSKLTFANDWLNLAEEEPSPVYTGDADFVTIELDSALKDFDRIPQSQKEARSAGEDRLMIFHYALGFGFLGALQDSPEELENLRREVATRVGAWGDTDGNERLCKQAYDYTDESPLDLAPIPTIAPMVAALVGLLLVLVVADGFFYYHVSADLKHALDSLIQNAATVQSPN